MNEHDEAPKPETAQDRAPQADAIPADEFGELRKRAEERDQYLDLLKRCRADFANYQKRVEEDRKRWTAAAQREIISQLLAASDQCRLAAEKSAEDHSADSLRGALCLVWSEVEKFLDAVGVTPIPAEGQEFDPDRHQALHVEAREDVPDSTVLTEIVRGYQFAGQVLRPAQVVVSRGPRRPDHEPGPTPEAGGASADFRTEGGEDRGDVPQ